MVKQPLRCSGDPYAVVAEFDRAIVKLWTTISFGNSNPAVRWPPKAAKDFKKETGKDLGRVARAKDIAARMLDAFPALRKLKHHADIWADLQYLESQAVTGTMLTLMREHHVPSLSMYDGIIIPRSKSGLAQTTLKKVFKEVVGVEPVLTIETAEPGPMDAGDL
jgi:hypothetical protein